MDATNVKRPVRIIVPFKSKGHKARLAPALAEGEREAMAIAMLEDVLDAVSGLGWVTVLTQPGFDKSKLAREVDTLESNLKLNEAINAFLEGQANHKWPFDILIVMADLALLTRDLVQAILEREGDVVLCPGRGGGTNMILIRKPEFRTCYQGMSFLRHLAYAKKAGLHTEIFESFRAGCDIDLTEDLTELLLHGLGTAPALLKSLGFSLSENDKNGYIREQSTDK